MANSISAVKADYSVGCTWPTTTSKDSDGSGAPTSSVGPAVKLTLSNVAKADKDSDGDSQ